MICYNHKSHQRILTGFVLLTKTLFQWLGSNLFAHPVYAAVVETSGALRRVLSIGMCLLWHSQLKDRLCMATGICVVI